jgi:hypothetical protein
VSADAPAPSRVKRWLREPLLHFLLAELALFAFNVGVEVSQLAFIAAVLGVFAMPKQIKLATVIEPYARPAAPYAIGILASSWFCERLVGFWTWYSQQMGRPAKIRRTESRVWTRLESDAWGYDELARAA